MGSYDVKIEIQSLRKAPVPLCLRVFFNRHKVPSSSLQWNDGLLSFRIDSSMFDPSPEQRLILTCNPVRPWKFGVPDRRRLDLPIFSVRFTPIWARVSDGEGCQPPPPLDNLQLFKRPLSPYEFMSHNGLQTLDS